MNSITLTTRLVLMALVALLLLAMWQIGVMLHRPDLLWAMGFGVLAGVPATLLVLAVAARSIGAIEEDAPEDAPEETPEESAPQSTAATATTAADYEEWLFDAPPELPATLLWRYRRLQEDAIARGWPHDDIDEWLAQNAERIEAEYRADYARMVAYHAA